MPQSLWKAPASGFKKMKWAMFTGRAGSSNTGAYSAAPARPATLGARQGQGSDDAQEGPDGLLSGQAGTIRHVARIAVPDGDGTERSRVWALRPDLGQAAAALAGCVYETSILPVRLRELVRMRIARVNACPI